MASYGVTFTNDVCNVVTIKCIILLLVPPYNVHMSYKNCETILNMAYLQTAVYLNGYFLLILV